MTKEEYESAKLAVIAEFGPAQWNGAKPVNRSAREMCKLRGLRATAGRKAAANYDAPIMGDADAGGPIRVLDIDISTEDLSIFSAMEKRIVIQYFLNIHQSNRLVAKTLGITHQTVNTLMLSNRFRTFNSRVMKRVVPKEAWKTVINGLRGGDDKLAVEMLRDAGEVKNETLVVQGRLEDPTALAELKSLGDRLAVGVVPVLPLSTTGDTLQ